MFGASFRIHLVCYSLHFYLQFELTDGWNVTVNLYMLCVANKVPELNYHWGLSNIQGTGKTSASKTFLDALATLEKKEKEDFDNNNAMPIDNTEEEDEGEEEWTPGNHRDKRRGMGTHKPEKKRRTGVSDEGRDDADYVERQKFHAKQVS